MKCNFSNCWPGPKVIPWYLWIVIALQTYREIVVIVHHLFSHGSITTCIGIQLGAWFWKHLFVFWILKCVNWTTTYACIVSYYYLYSLLFSNKILRIIPILPFIIFYSTIKRADRNYTPLGCTSTLHIDILLPHLLWY